MTANVEYREIAVIQFNSTDDVHCQITHCSGIDSNEGDEWPEVNKVAEVVRNGERDSWKWNEDRGNIETETYRSGEGEKKWQN